jgi:hypothetical protein
VPNQHQQQQPPFIGGSPSWANASRSGSSIQIIS